MDINVAIKLALYNVFDKPYPAIRDSLFLLAKKYIFDAIIIRNEKNIIIKGKQSFKTLIISFDYYDIFNIF